MTSKAETVTPPYDDATADDFNVVLFDVTTTHQAHAVPRRFWGQYVTLLSPVEVHFAFSRSASAEVDRAVAATAAGATAKVGGVLQAGERRHMLLPTPKQDETLYFVREAASASSVRVELSSR